MASITKLFTTTCIIILQEQGKLSLNDKISKYIDSNTLSGIHVYHGRDYSLKLTISDLLFQISGLPDVYLEGKDSLKNRTIQEDFYMTFSDMVTIVKKLKPHFEPGRNGKAYYADINFDILGEIIEKVSGLSLSEAYKKYIITPLGLRKRHIFLKMRMMKYLKFIIGIKRFFVLNLSLVVAQVEVVSLLLVN
jgi:CubicO group peptidase (beta-lactamase class C family)